jgi:DNA topoisomerase-1
VIPPAWTDVWICPLANGHLQAARAAACGQLTGRGLSRERVLAAAFILLDVGLFRIGGDRYAEEAAVIGLLVP